MALLGGWYFTCGRQRDVIDRSDKTSMAMIVMVSGEMVILPEIPLGRRMPPWSRRTDVVERVLTIRHAAELYRDEANRKHKLKHGIHHTMHNTYDAWAAQYMQVTAWQFTTIKHYTLSEARYATGYISTKLHAWLFSSLPIIYTAILNCC